MSIRLSKQQISLIIMLGIVALGAWLRFHNFGDKITFYGDDSRDFLTTYKIVKFHEWVWHGPAASVTWNLLSPIYYYLWIPVYLLTNWYPLTQPFTTTLISVVTIAAIFLTAKNLWDLKTGTIAGFIYAVSAIVIPENMIGLNPGLVPIATVLLLWSLLKVFDGKDKYFWVVAASLAWMISFHASAFFIIPPLLIMFIWVKPKISRKNLILAGLIFFVLVVIPYGIQEKKHGGYNFITVYNYFFRKAEPTTTPVVTLGESLVNYSQIIFKSPAEILFPVTNKALETGLNILLWISLIAVLVKQRKGFDHRLKYSLILLTVYSICFGLLIRYKDPERPNWWFGNVFFPIFSITAGVLIAKIRSRFVLCLVCLILALTNYFSIKSYEANQSFGRYTQEKQITDQVLIDASGSSFNLKYIFKGRDEDGAQGPFAYLFWYFDKPQFQEKYFRWLNWQKPPAEFPLYLVFQETSPSGKEAWLNKYSDHNTNLIQTTNFYEIYRED